MEVYKRVYAEIDLSAIRHNIEEVIRIVGNKVLIMPVIKADAYGHGAVKTAKAVEDIADYFAVATIEEAIELRQNDITKPLLILGYVSPEYYDDVVKYDIITPVFRKREAEALSEAAKKRGKIAKIHFVVDTGMGRIGFLCNDESINEATCISRLDNIEVDGIFSHFSTADQNDKEYSLLQISRFTDFCESLQKAGVKLPVRHICNSAGIIDLSKYSFDMVRSGIINYGLYPSEEVNMENIDLLPAMSLKSHVSHIKTLCDSSFVSYGNTYKTNGDRVIATIPVGYADGFPRLLSGKGRVLIHGQSAPIVGRVCMDQLMVDITDIEGVEFDDDVTLMGRDGEEFIGADEIAKYAGTISYEIVCGVSKRVPRIYKGM